MSEQDAFVHYIIHGPDGRIRQSGDCVRSMLPVYGGIFGEGFTAMEVSVDQYDRDIDVHCYVFDGIITKKSEVVSVTAYTVKADGSDEIRFAVPAGTSIIHDGQVVAIEDRIFEFATDIPGDYIFSFQAPAAYRDFEVTVYAV